MKLRFIIMPEKKDSTEDKMSANKCSCCPYGFHIDRDFVRYCDSLYNTAQLDKLRQHKRERRKEKKTVESYLGLGGVPAVHSAIEKSIIAPQSAATLPHTFHLHNDGLENAMLDFEDTWQKSLKKSCSSNDLVTKRNGLATLYAKPSKTLVDDQKDINFSSYNERSRSSSTSSVSSQSTAISSTSAPVTSDVSYSFPATDQNTSSVDVFYKSRVNSPYQSMGINRTVLSNIRERMASSLLRMKELEDQVKTIPVLQVKLYALAEEKKYLLNQLKAKQFSSTNEKSENQSHLENQLKRLENQGIMSPTLSRKCLSGKSSEDLLSSPGMASWLDASITKKHFIEKEIISHLNVKDVKKVSSELQKNMKNAGTSCSVLTRDIGIGYVPNKFKSVAVGSDISFKELLNSYKSEKNYDHRFTSVSSESLESDSESLAGSDEHSRSFLQTKFRKQVPSHNYASSNIPVKRCVASTNTETKCYSSKYINTDQSLMKSPKETERTYLNKSITASPSLSTKYVQTFDKKTSHSVGLQTSLDMKLKIQEDNKKHVLKRDAGVGDFNISDITCFNCKKIKKSVGVGDFTLKSVICDQCSSFKPHSRSKSSTSMYGGNCENCVLRQTETIGVGDQDINAIENCQNCEHIKSEKSLKLEKQSVSTNTSDDFSSSLSLSKSDMHICDKCSATIHSVAQGFAASTSDSKIPRPNIKLQSSAGKTNHTKLAKLKIQVSKTQKSESSVVKEVSTSRVESTEKKIVTTKSFVPKASIEYKSPIKDDDESKEFSKSPMLPDFTNLPVLPHKKAELSKEVKAACKVLNDYLQKPDRGGEKKTLSSLTIIQNEWFRVANQKKADPLLIEDYLDAFEDFSKLLLQRVVNLSDANGNTALHYAISYGNFDVVSILIDSKVCDVNKKNKAGYTSIMLVALADMKNDAHHYVVQRLFNIGDINIKATQNGQTALMLAVSHGKKDIVKILLDAGAEVNLQDKDGSTALMCAAEHGHLEIVRFLLSHPECDPTIVDNDDCNALTIAMEAGHKDIGLLIYTNMNFSRGSSPYSTLKTRKRSTPRSTPPPRTPTLRTPPLPSPSARSTNSIPSSFQFPS